MPALVAHAVAPASLTALATRPRPRTLQHRAPRALVSAHRLPVRFVSLHPPSPPSPPSPRAPYLVARAVFCCTHNRRSRQPSSAFARPPRAPLAFTPAPPLVCVRPLVTLFSRRHPPSRHVALVFPRPRSRPPSPRAPRRPCASALAALSSSRALYSAARTHVARVVFCTPTRRLRPPSSALVRPLRPSPPRRLRRRSSASALAALS
ncbi:hypothetical protein BDW22DRAFT_1432754 [Trametopsis cervina]|nr:hypothetical protein BDW22DRAFT_1432754 [Trametopsis cervina]